MAVEQREGAHQAQAETDPLSLFPEEEEPVATALELSVTARRVSAPVSPPIESHQPLAVNQAMAVRIQERAADTLAQLEQTRTAFDAQRNRFESGMVEVSRLGEHVSALEARIRKLTEPDQPLALGETMVNRLQQRAVDTKAQLDGTTSAFTAQKNTIASGLAEAARLAEIVSSLEKRIARLTEKDQSLGRAGTLVGHLEQRAVRATDRLEQVARATRKLGDDLERLQGAVRTTSEAARKQVEELAGHNDRPRLANSLRRLKPRAVGAAVVGGLSVLAVAGVIGTREHKPAQISITSPPAQGPLSPSSSPVLPESVTPIAIEPDPGTLRTTKIATDQRSRTAKPASDPVQRPAFTGDLSVQSNPVGAAVFIDRQYVGETPLQLTKLRAGSHVLRIEREGHERWTAAVLVTADKQVRVTANLQPER